MLCRSLLRRTASLIFVPVGCLHWKLLFPAAALFFLFAYAPTVGAQRNTDFGIIGGTSYYMGEVNNSRHLYSPSPAFGGIIRYRLNPRYSLRLSGIYTTLSGNDLDSNDPFQQARAADFRTSLVDASLNFEFNFLEYKIYNRKDRYTSYMTGGIGYGYLLDKKVNPGNSAYSTQSNAGFQLENLNLCFGGGMKVTLTQRLAGGAEWTVRKTFTDAWDGLHNPGESQFFHNKDWYSIVGVFITYKIWEVMENCPAYDQNIM